MSDTVRKGRLKKKSDSYLVHQAQFGEVYEVAVAPLLWFNLIGIAFLYEKEVLQMHTPAYQKNISAPVKCPITLLLARSGIKNLHIGNGRGFCAIQYGAIVFE